MLTILGRLDRRPPLKLGKSVLTLTESTKKYPLTAENLRPRGRLRGGRQISDRRPRGVNYATYGMYVYAYIHIVYIIKAVFAACRRLEQRHEGPTERAAPEVILRCKA